MTPLEMEVALRWCQREIRSLDGHNALLSRSVQLLEQRVKALEAGQVRVCQQCGNEIEVDCD